MVKEEKIGEIIQFYKIFIGFLTEQEANGIECCPVLGYILEHGNESVEIMKKRMAGEEVEEKMEDENCFVMVEDEKSDGSPEDEVKVDIDFGDIDISVENQGGDDGSLAGEPWELEIEVEDGGIDVVETTHEEQTSITESILEYSNTRNEFLDDLLELQAFLQQRLQEMKDKDNLVMNSILQKACKEISEQRVETVENMLTRLDKIISLLSDSKFRMIIEMKASTRYTERLVSDLKRHLETASRMEVLAAETQQKQTDVEENVMRLQLQKASKSKEAAAIKAHIQEQLPKSISRPVNIMVSNLTLTY